MFFCPPYSMPVCGMYTVGHLILLLIFLPLLAVSLHFSRHMSARGVLRTTRILTLTLWVLEILKIIFNFSVGATHPNNFVPLYFCSLILYAGLCSSFGRGRIKRAGDVFISTGAIVAGAIFLAVPITSLTMYPAFHFLSLHSMFLHSAMIYLGVLYQMRGVCRPKIRDIGYHAALVLGICLIAFVFNAFTDANLMFISRDYPDNPPLHLLFTIFGSVGYPIVMSLGQATLPFLLVWAVCLPARKRKKTAKTEEKETAGRENA